MNFAINTDTGRKVPVIIIGDGLEVAPYSVKCRVTGCRKRVRGYLTVKSSHLGGGAFYNKKGELLADLRNSQFVCPDHR